MLGDGPLLKTRRIPKITGNTSFCGLVYPLSLVFVVQLFAGASDLLQSQVHFKVSIYLTVSGTVGSAGLGFLLLLCYNRKHDSDSLVWTVVVGTYMFLVGWLCLGFYWVFSEEKHTDNKTTGTQV
ncbi:hypothetical protein MATL_G00168130 [Megalops atlanticus]|uniref:Uncharacterized protein n=1 Tax=Megalops atlanticus TaxID=7932 RepID=A0A9D3PSJ2_MEGAT|nr:hypothetical protein MATL_G00168130 [Megalops atlanticus]